MSSKAPSKEVIGHHLVANYFESLAPSLRDLIEKDPEAMVQLNGLRSVISLGAYNIAPEEFFQFLRSIVAGDSVAELYTHEGKLVPFTGVMELDGSAVLKDESHEYRFELAALLSESLDIRLEKIRALFNANTISERVEKYWLERVKQSALTDDEFGELEKVLHSSVERVLDKFRVKLNQNKFGLDECLPEHEASFVALLGSSSNEQPFSEYHEKVFLPQCKSFLEKGLVQGLRLIGPSCMLPDDVVVKYLTGYDNDELYDALSEVFDLCHDPFTLSFLLDICAFKLDKDVRFNALGCGVIEKLTALENDTHRQDFAIAIQLVLDALTKCSLLQTQSLYYRRLAAWTWSGHIVRVLSEFEFDRFQLLAELKEGLSFVYTIAGSIERRESPYWSTEWFTSNNLQGVIRRRVGQLFANIEGKGKEVPKEWQSIIENVDKSISDKDSFPGYLLPGPFDELCHESFKLLNNPSESKNLINKAKNCKSDIEFLAELLFFVNIFEVEESLMTVIRECAERINNSGLHDVDTKTVLFASQTLGYLAGVHRDQELAEIAAGLAHALTIYTNGETALFECYVIIYSACGYSDSKEFNAFVRDGVERLSNGRLSQYQAEVCLSVIERVSIMDPTLRLYLGRAKAGLNIAKRHTH